MGGSHSISRYIFSQIHAPALNLNPQVPNSSDGCTQPLDLPATINQSQPLASPENFAMPLDYTQAPTLPPDNTPSDQPSLVPNQLTILDSNPDASNLMEALTPPTIDPMQILVSHPDLTPSNLFNQTAPTSDPNTTHQTFAPSPEAIT